VRPARLALAALLLGALSFGGVARGAPATAPPWGDGHGSTPLAVGDFDNDGRPDLAVGVPHEDVVDGSANRQDAGAVQIHYGGIGAGRMQVWHQGSPGIPGTPEAGDRFGWSASAGDFDGDGFDDLAVSAPFERIEKVNAGLVIVLYGSATGIVSARSAAWDRGSGGVQGRRYANAYFGWALAAGNFDGDGYDDLAIGAPGELEARGGVNVLFGRASGLGAARDQLVRQGAGGVDGQAEPGDWFGAALAAGDLGYSSREEDLAIGSPGQSSYGLSNAGAVNVLYGQPGRGLTTTVVPDVYLDHGTDQVDGDPYEGASFGWSLAIADFGRGAKGDLAVGAPRYATRGAVTVFYSSSYGVRPIDDEIVRPQALDSTVGANALRFGHALAAANFDGAMRADLVVGAPATHWPTVRNGAVFVVYGTPLGLRTTGGISTPPQQFTHLSIAGRAREDDSAGRSVVGADFSADGSSELVIGAPGVDFSDSLDGADTGVLLVLHGSPGGLFRKPGSLWAWWGVGDIPELLGESGDRVGG
jgi:hypothetical protein